MSTVPGCTCRKKSKATDKAVDLIRMAIARSSRLEQVQDQQLGMVQSALVIGGGVGRDDLCSEHRGSGIPRAPAGSH